MLISIINAYNNNYCISINRMLGEVFALKVLDIGYQP